MSPKKPPVPRPLKGVRILSLALNLPGPAGLLRCHKMGATCVKLEPPAPLGAASAVSGDPMSSYCPAAYAVLHQGIRITVADLKTSQGQKQLHRELAKADVLLTSFRPSALLKLGLSWKALHQHYPTLSQVAILGSPGERAEQAGHDLTYLAENELITGLELPATLYADMGGALASSEAVLKAVLHTRLQGQGAYLEVALSEAAAFLALPHDWGLTKPGAALGGGHAGYQVYKCKDGRVAVAALEPHFAARLCALVGLPSASAESMQDPATRQSIGDWLSGKTRQALERLAAENDIPLHTLP